MGFFLLFVCFCFWHAHCVSGSILVILHMCYNSLLTRMHSRSPCSPFTERTQETRGWKLNDGTHSQTRLMWAGPFHSIPLFSFMNEGHSLLHPASSLWKVEELYHGLLPQKLFYTWLWTNYNPCCIYISLAETHRPRGERATDHIPSSWFVGGHSCLIFISNGQMNSDSHLLLDESLMGKAIERQLVHLTVVLTLQ